MYKAFITLLHKWHVAALLTMLAVPLSCTNDAPPMGNTVTGRDSLPVMTTYGVSKLITDSGVVRSVRTYCGNIPVSRYDVVSYTLDYEFHGDEFTLR